MNTRRSVRSSRNLGRPRFFAEAPGGPVVRRPADVVVTLWSSALALACALVGPGGSRDVDLAMAIASAGGAINTVWQILHDSSVVWCVVVLVACVVRRQRRVVGTIVLAIVIGVALGRVAAGIVDSPDVDFSSLLESLGTSTRTTAFPAMRVLAITAVLRAAAPSLARPMRRIGAVAMTIEVIAAIGLAVTTPVGGLAGWSIGLVAAAVAHLVVGSPGGRPSLRVIADSLRELEIDVDGLDNEIDHREGVAILRASSSAHGDIEVRLYGRDAIEGRLLTSTWRSLWYRDRSSPPIVGRRQQVEHEAFLTLFAERLGVSVPRVITAGTTEGGDDVLVLSGVGTPTSERSEALTAPQLDALWQALATLHASRVAHRRIDPSRLGHCDDGRVVITDWAAASVASPPDLFVHDQAQLFVTTVLLSGTDDAVDALRRALDDDEVRTMLPYLQEPALGRTLNRCLARSDCDLDDLRQRLAAAVETDEPELIALRRVTWKALLRLALLCFAGWLFVSSIADIGLRTIVDEVGKGDFGWLLAALVVGQLPRFVGAFSTIGSAPVALPYGPTATLEFAITFVNLAVPSSLGRMATKLRYLQRQGIGFAGATAMSALDNLSQFMVQISILLFTLGLGLGGVELDIDIDLPLPDHLLLIVVAVVGTLVGVTLSVPPLRRRVVPALAEMRNAFGVLRSPRKAAQIFGGNFGSELLFASTLGVCLHAFGGSASIVDLLVINTLVALFAGLMPVPGGIGVSEAAITAGLGMIGIEPDTAFAVALSYRMCTFYLPPLWGAVALRWLERHRFL